MYQVEPSENHVKLEVELTANRADKEQSELHKEKPEKWAQTHPLVHLVFREIFK